MSDGGPLDAWFLYAIKVAEMVYSMKLEVYEEHCSALGREAVAKAVAAAAVPATSSVSATATTTGANALSEDGHNSDCASPITPVSAEKRDPSPSQVVAAMRAHEELFALSYLRRPPTVMKRAEDCLDSVEAEKEAVYDELGEGYVATAEDEAAMRASQRTRRRPGSRLLPPSQCAGASPPSEEEGLGDLLYGELTSVGVRQLHGLCSRLIQEARQDLYPSTAEAAPADPGFIMEAVDIGSGTGKVLFEWARLAAREYLPHASASRHPATHPCGTERATCSPTHSDSPSSFPVPPSLVESFALPSEAEEGEDGGTPTPPRQVNHMIGHEEHTEPAGELSVHEEAASGSQRAVKEGTTRLGGWLGVGLELAPSRMAIARAALAPSYLDLVPESASTAVEGVLLSDEAEAAVAEAKKKKQDVKDGAPVTASTATRTMEQRPFPRFTPAPPRAVAVRAKWSPIPVGRQPAGCVLLHEGDALAPGLLTTTTLFRFPRPSALPGTAAHDSAATAAAHVAAAHRIRGKENYFKLCRGMPRVGRLSYREDVHLVLFCSGLGFDSSFVRLLCERLEALLPGCPGAEAQESGGRAARVAEGSAAAGHSWKSVTCVLLLRQDIAVTSPDFPLFRCVQEGRAGAKEQHQQSGQSSAESVPSWCVAAGGLKSSAMTVTHLDTTWMSEAPAWVVHFRY